jgi:hypothetical protein
MRMLNPTPVSQEISYTNLFTEATGGGVQLRVKTIKIVYAE